MKVVHLNKHEATGGAAIAAKRLHNGLNHAGIDSEMIVERTATDDLTVHSRSRLPNGISSIARFGLDRLLARGRANFSTGLVPSRAHRQLASKSIDVVHTHWVGDGFLSIRDIANVDPPLVWTLHDMWPITGGCHYPDGCSRYQDACGQCPVLNSNSESDLSTHIHRQKRREWKDVGFHLVAPSEWIAQLARDTGVVSNPDVTVIPNGIDTSYYTPDSSGGTYIETDQTNILFGAVSATSDPRKGYDLLAAALRGLPDSSDYACIVFGDDNPDLCKIGIQTESVGHLPEKDLIGLYGDCDVMVVPSRQESFGQTALEALACGTPVVAFNATGLRDIVVHKETGYLADPYDPADLRAGIEWVTHDEERQIRLARAARIDAEERFEIETTAGQYAELYDRVA